MRPDCGIVLVAALAIVRLSVSLPTLGPISTSASTPVAFDDRPELLWNDTTKWEEGDINITLDNNPEYIFSPGTPIDRSIIVAIMMKPGKEGENVTVAVKHSQAESYDENFKSVMNMVNRLQDNKYVIKYLFNGTGVLSEDTAYGMPERTRRTMEVMEFLAGGPVSFVIDTFYFLTNDTETNARRIRHYVAQMTNPIIEMHQEGWYHRDLKPEQWVLDDQGTAKLIDFETCAKTTWNRNDGTMSYTPRERFIGDNWFSSEAGDVWSMGYTIFEMVMTKRPFENALAPLAIEAFESDYPGEVLFKAHGGDMTKEFIDICNMWLRPEEKRCTIEELAAKVANTTSFTTDGSQKILQQQAEAIWKALDGDKTAKLPEGWSSPVKSIKQFEEMKEDDLLNSTTQFTHLRVFGSK